MVCILRSELFLIGSLYFDFCPAGIYGSGNYDDGFTAAQQTAEEQTQKLNTIVGVLAGIITVMALGIIGGAYFLHSRTKRVAAMQSEAALETVQSTTEQDNML